MAKAPITTIRKMSGAKRARNPNMSGFSGANAAACGFWVIFWVIVSLVPLGFLHV
jgi:hypothetical protein